MRCGCVQYQPGYVIMTVQITLHNITEVCTGTGHRVELWNYALL